MRFLISIAMALGAVTARAEKVLEKVRQIPHTGYSEGIDFHDGALWHTMPKELVKIDPADGSILARYQPPTEWSESLVWFEGKLWNLSFSNNGIYAGVLEKGGLKFERRGSTPEECGWGITHDGKHLIVTGTYGSHKLYFLNPKTLALVRTIETPVGDLEDLAWDGKGIWASSFKEHPGEIFRIDPKSGKIPAFFKIPDADVCPVIDGIATEGKNLWVTGKNCLAIYLYKKPRL